MRDESKECLCWTLEEANESHIHTMSPKKLACRVHVSKGIGLLSFVLSILTAFENISLFLWSGSLSDVKEETSKHKPPCFTGIRIFDHAKVFSKF